MAQNYANYNCKAHKFHVGFRIISVNPPQLLILVRGDMLRDILPKSDIQNVRMNFSFASLILIAAARN